MRLSFCSLRATEGDENLELRGPPCNWPEAAALLTTFDRQPSLEWVVEGYFLLYKSGIIKNKEKENTSNLSAPTKESRLRRQPGGDGLKELFRLWGWFVPLLEPSAQAQLSYPRRPPLSPSGALPCHTHAPSHRPSLTFVLQHRSPPGILPFINPGSC